MQLLIIEDEKLASDKLVKLLNEIDKDIEISGVLRSVDQSIDWLNSNPSPDLILSDIHLEDGICFNIFSKLNSECPVIFTTAYEKYAVQAFEVNSIDYLLKPIQSDKLKNALDKLEKLKSIANQDRQNLYEEFKEMLVQKNKEYKSRFLCKLGNKIKSVKVENIRYFYSESKMTFIVDIDGHRYSVNNTLDEIDQMVDPDSFFRVNRKYIAHFESIDEIHPYFKGRLKIRILPGKIEDIIVSSERAPLFKVWLQ